MTENQENILDPFGASLVTDYSKLIVDLGLKTIDQKILKRVKKRKLKNWQKRH